MRYIVMLLSSLAIFSSGVLVGMSIPPTACPGNVVMSEYSGTHLVCYYVKDSLYGKGLSKKQM